MKKIYVLMHTYVNDDEENEDKILGYFETKEKARLSIKHYLHLPGFCNHRDGFLIDTVIIGRLYWEEGFEKIV